MILISSPSRAFPFLSGGDRAVTVKQVIHSSASGAKERWVSRRVISDHPAVSARHLLNLDRFDVTRPQIEEPSRPESSPGLADPLPITSAPGFDGRAFPEGEIMSEHWSFNDPLIPPGEPVHGKTYRADGWQYVDLPSGVRLSLEARDYFFRLIGEGNYVILAATIRPDSWRGQLLISPDGQRRMRERTIAENYP